MDKTNSNAVYEIARANVGLAKKIEELEDQLKQFRWIQVEERLPENEKAVLICAERRCRDKTYKIISTAFYMDGTTWSKDSAYTWEDISDEYDEEKNDCLVPEGWWEDTNYTEVFAVVDDFVIAWMPLPEPYKPEN